VGYSYTIGKYEVTNTQYAAFLNSVAKTDAYSLYSERMGSEVFGGITQSGSSGSYSYAVKSGYENKPVVYVSFWDAARFANWLNNGQGAGSTETGSYTLTSEAIHANSVTRNSWANWVVPTADEWYKAAYHGAPFLGGYWTYPTRSFTLNNNTTFTGASSANYYDGDFVASGSSTLPIGDGALPAGTYVNAMSSYGTFDQAGNVWEWNESIVVGLYPGRGLLGGSWNDPEFPVSSSFSGSLGPSASGPFEDVYYDVGFRVVSLAPIPEPSTSSAAMGMMALGMAVLQRRRSRLARRVV
jgi:formylglycine-generating enzyme required for sulfatase activity